MAARSNFTIEQGATYEATVTYLEADEITPISLAGYSAKMQVRLSHRGALILTLTSDIGGGLTIDASVGKITIRIGADQTRAITARRAVYDLELTSVEDDTEVIRLVEGIMTMSPEVTL